MAENADDWDVKSAFNKLSASLEQPDKFAEVFCKAAESQKIIDTILKKNIKEVVKTDKETYDFLKKIARDVDKEDWRSYLSKIGAAGWAIALLVLGAVLQGLSKHYL